MENQVGFAAVLPAQTLNGAASIFTAEMNAIKTAIVGLIRRNRPSSSNKMLSDSQSALMALKSNAHNSAMETEIQLSLYHASDMKTHTIFCWVSGHLGIVGNENADSSVKSNATMS